MTNTSLLKLTSKQGLFMGLGFCLYTTLMWLTKLDTTYLSLGQYLDMAIIILPIIMIIWAIRNAIKVYRVNVFQRILIAIFVGAISYIIYDPFLYVYHHFINPEWYTAVINLKETELKAANVPQDKILENLLQMKSSNVAQSAIFRLSTLIPSVIIIPTLIALISMIFIKTKNKVKE